LIAAFLEQRINGARYVNELADRVRPATASDADNLTCSRQRRTAKEQQ
jgi:hypothetical protein